MNNWLILSILLLVVIPAAIIDARQYRIPNIVCAGGCIAGIVMWGILDGVNGVLMALAGMGIAFAVFILTWLLGWIGAGDVKLIAAVGAIVAWPDTLIVLAGIAFAGFFLSVLFLLMRGMLLEFLQRCWASLGISLASRHVVYIEQSDQGQAVKLPYGIAIAVGSSVTYMLYCM